MFVKYNLSPGPIDDEIEKFLKILYEYMKEGKDIEEMMELKTKDLIIFLRNMEFEEHGTRISDYEYRVFLTGVMVGQIMKTILDQMQATQMMSSLLNALMNIKPEQNEQT